MARSMDVENLTPDDVAYLESRQWLINEIELQGYNWQELREDALAEQDGVKEDGNTQGEPQGEPEDKVEDKEAEEDEVEYEDLTISQLHEELDARELEYASKANKAELIAILEKDDEESDDSESE